MESLPLDSILWTAVNRFSLYILSNDPENVAPRAILLLPIVIRRRLDFTCKPKLHRMAPMSLP